MVYCHSTEKESFKKKWEAERKILNAAGATEEMINELYEFDLKVFRSDRNFRIHNRSFAEFEESNCDAGENSPVMKENLDVMSVQMDFSYRAGGRYGWIDEMDSEWLALALKQLTGEEIELLTVLFDEEYSQTEAAKKLGKSPAWIVWKKKAIREKLERARSMVNHTS